MEKIISFGFLIICSLLISGCATGELRDGSEIESDELDAEVVPRGTESTKSYVRASEQTFTIANWNLQRLGDRKGNDEDLIHDYALLLSPFDIVFVQEVTNEQAFQNLCATMGDEYACRLSVPAGTTYKESYGLLFRTSVAELTELIDLEEYGMGKNGDGLWMRPPLIVTFNINNYTLTLVNVHIKPDSVEFELGNIASNIDEWVSGNGIILGDLNADCSFYNPQENDLLENWYWLIGDDADTTMSNSECAYDRIIANSDANSEVLQVGIIDEGITHAHSDHYIVWVELEAKDKEE